MRVKGLRIVAALLMTASLSGGIVRGQDWHQGKGRLEGTVTNGKGEPIAGATVALRFQGSGPDLKTDKKGQWSVLGLTGGGWQADISAPGFQSKKISLAVSEGSRNQPVNLSLEPEVREAPRTEVQVGGKTVSKGAAEAIEKGNAASKAKNYGEAEENYLKALAELPDNASLLSNLALSYYFDNKPDQAIEFARKLARVDPNSTTAWLMISELELQKGHLEAGQEALAKVPEGSISSPEPYLNMGILLYNTKRLAEADDAFTRAIAKKPDYGQAYYYRGLERYQAKRTAEARVDLQKSIDLDPSGKDSETAREIIKSMK